MTPDMICCRQRSARSVLWTVVTLVGVLASEGCKDSPLYPTRDGGTKDLKKETGPINITGTLNPCPTVVIIASPNRNTVGAQSTLMGNAADPDDDLLTYRWEANIGMFGSPTLAETTFTCTEAGSVALKLTVDDGDCKTVETATLLCTPGDGGIAERADGRDAGPADAQSDGTNASDARDAATGTGGQTVDAAPGGSGGSVNGGTGGRGSGGAPGTGGGGGSGMPGTGGASSSGGSGAGGGTGGAGASSSGGAPGTGGSATGGGSGNGGRGGATSTGGAPASTGGSSGGGSCDECSHSLCDEDPPLSGCWTITDPSDKQLCENVLNCFITKHCIQGDDTFNGCYCGDSKASCASDGAANGPCIAEAVAAAKLPPAASAGPVIARWNNGAYPLGRATNQVSCQTTLCPMECKDVLGL